MYYDVLWCIMMYDVLYIYICAASSPIYHRSLCVYTNPHLLTRNWLDEHQGSDSLERRLWRGGRGRPNKQPHFTRSVPSHGYMVLSCTIPMGIIATTPRKGRGGGNAEARLSGQTWDASLRCAASKNRGLPRLCRAAAALRWTVGATRVPMVN